jgi:hypothetical protein
MHTYAQPIFVGDTPLKQTEKVVRGEYTPLFGELFYKIQNFDGMEPFFISLVSSSDHWLFISSTGGLSAGRGSAEQSIFPYYTVDKLTENSENSGSKAILLVERGQRTSLWEPFSERHAGSYALQRNLYKNVSGTALVFEELNLDLGLTYRYAWRTSEKFGFVRTAWLANTSDSACQVELLDGIQNILPANITSQTQNTFSSLLEAYKRSELDPATGLAIFALNSRLTDLAEPSESLQATTVAQIGLEAQGCLLSSLQLDAFRSGKGIQPETEVRGRRGAYFVHATLSLAPGEERTWHLVADAQQDSAAIAQKMKELQGNHSALRHELEEDIAASQASLWKIVASADGLQQTNNALCTAHHFANVMFNGMRGGIFADQYWILTRDLIDFVSLRNRPVLRATSNFFASLPERVHVTHLLARAEAAGVPDLVRLCYAYLPLTFSRRHGDPSRPWNRFAINIKKADGSLKLDYEGNWRDIFQNWEALAYSYPEFVEGMISTFLNATTVDGYNPYRITHRGLDWEVPEPGNPWANIGYWSDHQIIYLQKLMEISLKMHPGKLQDFLDRPAFSYAHVPYHLKPYSDLLKDSNNTIEFNWDLERQIEARRKERGTDGNLVMAGSGEVLQVSLAEKLLTLLLAKLANFVPEGGIWMNTQRPEWNDANNALVGKGLSVVTLCYLRRYIAFCRELFANSTLETVPLNSEVEHFYISVADILGQFQPALQGSFDDEGRRLMMDALGEAGSDYRWNFYRRGFAGRVNSVLLADLVAFLDLAQAYVEHTLRANKRGDDLYHAYNILHLERGRARVTHLYEMLEGQVAILSSGLLSGEEALALLQSLRHSALYQASQHSYILYPDRDLRPFMEKNTLTAAQIGEIKLFAKLVEAGDRALITWDVNGFYHFSGPIRNFQDVSRALDALKAQPRYAALVEAETEKIRALFEETFHHNEFTGRSGTFFAYEGLGSVYWHMVSKLLLAAQEAALLHRQEPAGSGLRQCYADIRQGLSFNKPPDVYGAFPTDPYSHTPKGQGAKQPGMTGMVKEEILTRLAELGASVEGGRLVFDRLLLDRQELLSAPAEFEYLDVSGQRQTIELKAGSLAYTICQAPVVLEEGEGSSIRVHNSDGSILRLEGKTLDEANSRHIFLRDGTVHHLTVTFPRA